jgi:propanol-preferring alcohol dehydrogenase
MVRRKGTVSLVGLPPGEFQTPIFDVVLNRKTIRGSIVGGREDLAEAIAFAAEGKVRAEIHRTKLDNINQVFLAESAAPQKILDAGAMHRSTKSAILTGE